MSTERSLIAVRTREVGIRAALGANRWSIARDVATRAVVQIVAGVLLGLMRTIISG